MQSSLNPAAFRPNIEICGHCCVIVAGFLSYLVPWYEYVQQASYLDASSILMDILAFPISTSQIFTYFIFVLSFSSHK